MDDSERMRKGLTSWERKEENKHAENWGCQEKQKKCSSNLTDYKTISSLYTKRTFMRIA